MSKKKPRQLCLNCHQECPRPEYVYCSNKCQQELRQRKNVESGTASSKSLRHYLLRIRGNKCQICNLEVWNNEPIPIVLDHIDGNSENNKLENLRLICCNCDALLPTYKGRNKGKGRYLRKLRYQQGKSY